jgi:hypothetical protein
VDAFRLMFLLLFVLLLVVCSQTASSLPTLASSPQPALSADSVAPGMLVVADGTGSVASTNARLFGSSELVETYPFALAIHVCNNQCLLDPLPRWSPVE